MSEKLVLPQGVREITASVEAVNVVENNAGGYIEFVAIDMVAERMVIETFMLGDAAIRNSMNSLAIWVNALVRNNKDAEPIIVPDFRAKELIASKLGKEFNKELATQEFLQTCVNELRTLIGTEIHIHQTTNEGVTRAGIRRQFKNYNPYPYGSNRVTETTGGSGTVNLAGILE